MRYWLGAVPKDHVIKGAAGSFCQLCHGRKASQQRMRRAHPLLFAGTGFLLRTLMVRWSCCGAGRPRQDQHVKNKVSKIVGRMTEGELRVALTAHPTSLRRTR